ncbi:MAG: electron transport complex subunit RsxC [Lachnospiraceae bacterium]|nr:electron transport complex subunit RsxC [Lachnospiraceae bacterium]
MRHRSFRGGVHPNDGKAMSAGSPIEDLLPGSELVFPLSQHIGAPATALVAVGDRVLKGQLIAGGERSVPIHASVSGNVKAIEKHLTVNGRVGDAIIIENDGAYEEVPEMALRTTVEEATVEEIMAAVQGAGIVGLGGAGFPAFIKFKPPQMDAIDHIIVNGAECEPYLTSDYRLMLEKGPELLEGLRLILKMFPKAKGVIAIEDNKPDCIEKLTELCKNEANIEVMALKTKYPQGGERFLIHAVTGRDLNVDLLPAHLGCIVNNVATVIAIYEAVCLHRPLISKVVTVTGDAIRNPKNFRVPMGMSYDEIAKAAGGFDKEPEKLVSGGPMMGQAMFSLEVPVSKITSALLALSHDEVADFEPTACIRCGRCVEACPENLVPVKMMDACEHKDFHRYVDLNGMECCECGTCTYVCPAKRRLTQAFKDARNFVRLERRIEAEKKKAAEAKKAADERRAKDEQKNLEAKAEKEKGGNA